MTYTIFDLEADGLLDTITKIHCVSYTTYIDGEWAASGFYTEYADMINFFKSTETLVGHNIVGYDIPAVQKILKIEVEARLIDTLALSWYLHPDRILHGLEAWGEELGVAKPKIDDWENLTVEEYVHRCEEDVEINVRLFEEQMYYLNAIYSDEQHVNYCIDYLTWKMDCLREQQEVGIHIDTRLCEETKMNLEFDLASKVEILSKVMPARLGKTLKTRPKVFTKKDGTLSAHGAKWIAYLEANQLSGTLEVVRDKPNPGSSTQLKEWLFELGWTPVTFKSSTSKLTPGKLIPQVSLPFGGGMCPSIKELYSVQPKLVELENYYMIRHRIGLLKGFETNMDSRGRVYARANGFTNTLRLKHAVPVVNLPGVDKPYGREIRGCLTVPDATYMMCGSDISGLESATGQHYIYFFDPEYVTKLRQPGYDPHTDLAVIADMMTVEEENWYKEKSKLEFKDLPKADQKELKRLKKVRAKAKTVNFAAIYGAGAKKIADTLKEPLAVGQALHTAYWNLNHAVKKTAKAVKTKTVEGQKWLYNPVSNLWLFLKEDKDKFSTLNQSTGVFFFDTWLMYSRKKFKEQNLKVALQYHDEQMLWFPKAQEEFVKTTLNWAIQAANDQVKLNVQVGISIDMGNNYAECH